MSTADQQKVIKAGFILVRPDNMPSPRIKVKDGHGQSFEWRTLAKFDTRAARDRELKKILESNTVIQD
jgi:hypothetical protein